MVGKSCLMLWLNGEDFPGDYVPTLGLDYIFKFYTSMTKERIKLQIWDTAGQDSLHTFTHSMVKDADAIIVVYDCADVDTFDKVSDWLESINRLAVVDTQALVANKIDLPGW